ncbi:MAG TPA: hypothetical protein VGT98_15345 [Candidatus Elarobacter sp.]|nr:hypothetical protein [Candidatus Elarobacter sp.]
MNKTEGIQRIHATPPAPAPSGAVAGAESASVPPRADDVHISDAGRALSGSVAPADAQSAPSDVDAVRANELRTRIFTGAYNELGVAEQVARAIVRSGDL